MADDSVPPSLNHGTVGLGSRLFKVTKMRATAMIFLLCMSFDSAGAQTTEQCQLVQRAGDLLDCYNGAAPPHRPVKRKTSKVSTAPYKPSVSEAQTAIDKAASKAARDQKAQYVDELAVENSKLDAKMKTICRGC